MSCPPLPDNPDVLLDPDGDYNEVPPDNLREGVLYIFFNELTQEMMCVHILFINDKGQGMEIAYRVFYNNGDYDPIMKKFDLSRKGVNTMKAFRKKTQLTIHIQRQQPPSRQKMSTPKGGTKRKRKNKKSKKYKKSRKTRTRG
jgi:hypothetical protein